MDISCTGDGADSSLSDYCPKPEPPELIAAKRALTQGRSLRRPPIGNCPLCEAPIQARWQAKTLACGHVFHFDCVDAIHREALKVTADLRCPLESCDMSVAPTIAALMVDLRTRRGVPIGKELEDAVNKPPPKITKTPLAAAGACVVQGDSLEGACAEQDPGPIERPAFDAIDALLRGEHSANANSATKIEDHTPPLHPDLGQTNETPLGGVNTEVRAQNRGGKPIGKRPRPGGQIKAGPRPPRKSLPQK